MVLKYHSDPFEMTEDHLIPWLEGRHFPAIFG